MPVDTLTLTRIPAVQVGMLIRRPHAEVFQAFVDPSITTRFWFTRSTGPIVPGAQLRWHWDMYGVSTTVAVKEVEDGSRILFEWDADSPTTVEFRFIPWENGTYVTVTETGLTGDGDQIAAHLAESTGGFTTVLCVAKALLEHDIVLRAVADHHPEGVPS